jgi:hypothetical protein
MNRTIKEATVKRYHYDTHRQLETHLIDFMGARNYARRLKTLCGLTPYESICKARENDPQRFTVNPHTNQRDQTPSSGVLGAVARQRNTYACNFDYIASP